MVARAATPLTVALALASLSAVALADQASEAYEQALVERALAQTGLEPEPHPEGKVIERVEIVREEIFGPEDPWPDLLNLAHYKTRDVIVRQEMLVAPGEVWDAARVEEGARTLRAMAIMAIVRAIPCRSRNPGQVVLLVATKDLWSIRLNQSFFMVGPVLGHYETWPTENNLLGLNNRVSLNLRVQQLDLSDLSLRDNLTLGQLYLAPRVHGTRLRLTEAFRVSLAGAVPCGGRLDGGGAWCLGARPGTPEGVNAVVGLEQPLFSESAEWGFEVYGIVNLQQRRAFRFNLPEQEAPLGEQPGLSLRADRYSDTVAVPRVYQARELEGVAELRRSFGRATKQDWAGGVVGYSYQYQHPGDLQLSPALADWHARTYLPKSEQAAYAFLRYRTYTARFVRAFDVQTSAVSEDFKLGRDLQLELRLGSAWPAPAQAFAVGLAAYGHRWHRAGNLLSVGASARSRWQPGLAGSALAPTGAAGPFYDSQVAAEIKETTPVLWLGRLHLRGRAILRRDVVHGLWWEIAPENELVSKRLVLGSRSGLRGYPSDQFEGDSLAQVNVEARSLPVALWSLYWGVVLFYDGGLVFGGPDPLEPARDLQPLYRQSVGVGVRGHFPNFDKEVLRIDFAVPLSPGSSGVATWISLSFGQLL